MIDGLLIRRATVDDVDRIVRLSNAGGPEGKPLKDLPKVLPRATFEAFARIDADPRQRLCVAEFNRTVVATFHLTTLTYLAGEGADDLLIEAFHVDEAHRKQGIGSAILAWVRSEAERQGCRRIQLTTDKRRADAHRFYARHGFVASHEGMKLRLS